jgi:hypothetical protein
MKARALLIAAALLAAAISTTYAQTYSGVVNYNSGGSATNARVFVCYTGPGEGLLASGTAYQTALFWGPAGITDMNAMVQVGGNVSFLTGAAAGTFFGSGRTITYTSPQANGAVVALQSRTWQVQSGVTGWGNATFKGFGPIFEMDLKDPTLATEPTPTISQAAGWRGYALSLSPCPEPSTIALGLLGAGALLILRRRT